MMDSEKMVKRNPHGNFKEVEASRSDWQTDREWTLAKTKAPEWKPGQGSNDNGEWKKHKHIDIDPYQDGRPATFNYKYKLTPTNLARMSEICANPFTVRFGRLLISAIVPRPIGFVSTRSKDGSSTNLAPFSYTQMVNHDPPIFIVGYSGGFDQAKDSLRNLVDSGECVINIISEHYVEAANATSVNAPYGISEWALTGLTPMPCKDVKASRVGEAVFSVEGKLLETKEYESRVTPGKKTGVLAIIEGTRFWAREDALNEEQNLIDPNVSGIIDAALRPC
jgi:flavin reductase (DIM6/NTAB) family NADH-FMN oxidoreductase RutF